MKKLLNAAKRLFKRFQKPKQAIPGQRQVSKQVRLTEQEFWRQCLEDVKAGKRHDPLMLSDTERHHATREQRRKLKWSKDFAYRMRTPMHRQLSETGRAVNLIGGADFTTPEMYASPEELAKALTDNGMKALGGKK